MNNGILIIALGHPNYLKMAFNLAVSIKHNDPEAKICLVHDGNSLEYLFRYDITKYFDYLTKIPDDYLTPKGALWFHSPCYIRAKMFLYDLSPFDNTLFLDADTIWLPRKKPSALFKELEGVEFAMANRGFADLATETDKGFSQWCDINQVKEKYGEGKFYRYHSEVVYFTRTEANKQFFETAKNEFDNCKVGHRTFAGAIPDEVPFAVSSIINHHYPHASNWLPEYWPPAQKKNYLSEQQIYERFYLFSIGGNQLEEQWKEIYDRTARMYFQRERLQFPYQCKHNNKKRFLKEREKI